jgi:hypothetical protein
MLTATVNDIMLKQPLSQHGAAETYDYVAFANCVETSVVGKPQLAMG